MENNSPNDSVLNTNSIYSANTNIHINRFYGENKFLEDVLIDFTTASIKVDEWEEL